jgi:ribonuclease T2
MKQFVRSAIFLALAFPIFGQFHLPGSGKTDSTPKTKAPVPVAGPVAAASAPTGSAVFEYYVLALSWAPGKGGPFVVRGLLPEAREGAGPEFCSDVKDVKKVSRAVMNLVLPLMASQDAVQQEWLKHGSCSGLSATDYFNGVRYTRSQVQIPVQMTSLEDATTQTPFQIETQFAGANPGFPEGAFKAGCDGGRFTEVRVCFDAQFKPRECTATAGECAAAELSIRPRD